MVLQLGLLPLELTAQFDSLPNFRYYDKRGVNVFESPKEPVEAFKGIKFRLGAGLAQAYQSLSHSNDADGKADNALYTIHPGFTPAMANFSMDVQLITGTRFNLTCYLSTRSRNEARLKAGYLQFDKLPLDSELWEKLMQVITIRTGLMEVNYGDAHFRRSDGGQAIYNPFIENYIVDACATETGAEVHARKNGFFALAGISNGVMWNNRDSQIVSLQNGQIHNSPAFYGKAGMDKSVGERFRLRLSGSFYYDASSENNSLFAGEGAGSNYFMVMEKAPGVTYAANAFSGRLNPGFTNKVSAFQLNGFFKLIGFEVFATYEEARGRNATENRARPIKQYAVDWVFRFGNKENLFIASRYNAVTARLQGIINNVKIDRVVMAAGYFFTNNILLKAEAVNQYYKDFPQEDYRNEGKFNGGVIQVVIGF
ncbi:hypothetical protein FAM09_13740 [Niastella caeni]|uniref:Porin n=2 Tax=Niastella caeni TaxID=2569763 RepID=A0A4S8HY91_9BACT|nr:hypothetical protein FAM09_13740 [Niastella caeni]